MHEKTTRQSQGRGQGNKGGEGTEKGPKRATIDVVGRQVASFDSDLSDLYDLLPACSAACCPYFFFFSFFFFYCHYLPCCPASVRCPLPLRRLIVIQDGGDFIMGITTQPSAEPQVKVCVCATRCVCVCECVCVVSKLSLKS